MKTGMRLDDGMRDFLRYLAVALCSAIVTYHHHIPTTSRKESLF